LRASTDEASNPMARVEVMEIISSSICLLSGIEDGDVQEEEKGMLPV
jgi:hypothetical protein